MREVLISIQPQHVENILNGKKIIEIRKTMPKCALPCKVYIYCTNSGRPLVYGQESPYVAEHYTRTYGCSRKEAERLWDVLNGKVVAEFTLNEVDFIKMPTNLPHEFLEKACVNGNEIMEYLGGNFYKSFYAWHIDNLEIYDEPKELNDFCKPCPMDDKYNCLRCEYYSDYSGVCMNYVNRPPQSWCYVDYVEELQEE